MNFIFPVKITKELILSKFSEEQIMEYYLRVPITKKLFRSPLRQDHLPTCSLYRNGKGELIFKDFATGQYLNVFGVVQTMFQCDYWTSLQIIANDFGIVKNNQLHRNSGRINLAPTKVEEKESAKIQVEIQPFTDLELKWWGRYGVTPEILQRFDVYSCKHVFLNGNLCAKSQQHCPIFGYYGKKYQGNELWRCYFPERKEYRFLTNWPAKKIQGYDQLPKKGKLLIITKSMKDVLCLYSCGLTAIAPNSENLFISDTILSNLKTRFERIVVFYDNDRPGLYNMAKIRKQHPELTYTFIPKEYGVKDISDFYKKFGRKRTLNFIKQFILWLRSRT